MSSKNAHIEDLDTNPQSADLSEAEAERVAGGLIRPVASGECTVIDTIYPDRTVPDTKSGD